MSKFNFYLLAYFTVISIISFITVIVDKRKAIKGKRRISEATLFALAAIGGSAFMYFSMCIFKHKTQKNRFVFGIPLIFLLQCVILYALLVDA